jgi:hypothetical protein
MKGIMLVIHPGIASPATHLFKIDGPPTPDIIKGGINGGSLETVPYFNKFVMDGQSHRCVAFCDEDGKGKGLRFNVVATALWQEGLTQPIDDWLAGPVVVLFGDNEFMEAI